MLCCDLKLNCFSVEHFLSKRINSLLIWLQSNDKAKEYVHMLNSTLTATERTMCCILENHQKEDGVEIPEVLRVFMGGKAFIPFKNNTSKEAKGKKTKE